MLKSLVARMRSRADAAPVEATRQDLDLVALVNEARTDAERAAVVRTAAYRHRGR